MRAIPATRFGPWLAVLGMVAAFAFTGMSVVYVFNKQHETEHKICVSTVENRAATRLTWDAARDLILAGQTDDKLIDRTNDFFNRVLVRVPALRCEGNEPVEVG